MGDRGEAARASGQPSAGGLGSISLDSSPLLLSPNCFLENGLQEHIQVPVSGPGVVVGGHSGCTALYPSQVRVRKPALCLPCLPVPSPSPMCGTHTPRGGRTASGLRALPSLCVAPA